MERLRRVLSRVDGAVYQVERALLVVSVAMMTVLLSLDVLQRTFSRPVGKTAALILAVLGEVPEQTRALVVHTIGPGVFDLISLGFCVLAIHARRALRAEADSAEKPRFVYSVVWGIALWGFLAVVVKFVLWLFPSSVPGAQKFALGFMLWAGLLGASLATRARRHIVLDAVKKKLEPGMARVFALLGGVSTFLFCGWLSWLGVLQLASEVHDWATGEGVGVYDALPIPEWIATLAIPLTFFLMASRFLAQGVHDLVWGPPAAGKDAHGIDLESLGAEAPGQTGEGG